MLESLYRRRLEQDLTRWQAEGILTAETAGAIRRGLPAIRPEIGLTLVIAAVGGLLVGAAAIAFVAANWAAIPRFIRLAVLLTGIAAAHGLGAWFDRNGRTHLGDLAVGVGTVVFGAAIALVGQMYHLGDDFAAAILLWACGGLVAAALTRSRGALAVALVAACIWNFMRSFETPTHLYVPFVPFWAIAALLVVTWNDLVSRHLIALSAVAGWLTWDVAMVDLEGRRLFLFCAGMSLLLGGGLAIASYSLNSLRAFGSTLSIYGAVALAVGLALAQSNLLFAPFDFRPAAWVIGVGAAGLIAALAVGATHRSLGAVLIGLVIGLALSSFFDKRWQDHWYWLGSALALGSMLCLIISGILDDVRPRTVAGWIGVAALIVKITWGMTEPLLYRAAFLAVAGIFVIALASIVARLTKTGQPNEAPSRPV